MVTQKTHVTSLMMTLNIYICPLADGRHWKHRTLCLQLSSTEGIKMLLEIWWVTPHMEMLSSPLINICLNLDISKQGTPFSTATCITDSHVWYIWQLDDSFMSLSAVRVLQLSEFKTSFTLKWLHLYYFIWLDKLELEPLVLLFRTGSLYP